MLSKIILSKRNVSLRKAMQSPNFNSKTVLVTDPFEYVSLWLRREKKHDAHFYWQQAEEFYRASQVLPLTASPLSSYYCFLNAVKSLLLVKNITYDNWHGLKGNALNRAIGLHNERVILCKGGIFPELCRYFEQPITEKTEYTLRQLLYNLVYIHRAYCLTYPNDENKELFIPLEDSYFIRDTDNNKLCFYAVVDSSYASGHSINKISSHFSNESKYELNSIKYKTELDLSYGKFSSIKLCDDARFIDYHKEIRRRTQYIAGPLGRWYIKRYGVDNSIELSPLPIMMAAMHRLSELSRYDPIRLSKTLESRSNWLLSEFIRKSPWQFMDEIAAEITGNEFLLPRSHI